MKILLITAFAKRDLGVCFVLSKMFKKSGITCKITSEARATQIHYRMWNPDAILIFRESSFNRFSSLYDKAQIFYCPGEGGEQYEFAEERDFVKDYQKLDKVNHIFLWGQKSIRHLNKELEEGDLKNKEKIRNLIKEKVTVCGHPRMDIARMYNAVKSNNNKIKIGLIGSFSVINHSSKNSTLLKILNGNSYENAEFQIKLALTYKKICAILQDEEYEISIRPYISENYNQYEKIKFKNVNIDSCIDFNSWVAKQDIIIGPTSSTIPQLAVSGKKYILVDFVDNHPEQTVYRISLSKLFHENMPNNIPRSFDELVDMIKNYRELETSSEGLNQILMDVYNINTDSEIKRDSASSLKNICDIITNTLKTSKCISNKLYVPGVIVDFIDKYIISYDENSYNDIVYSSIESSLDEEFNPIIKEYLKI